VNGADLLAIFALLAAAGVVRHAWRGHRARQIRTSDAFRRWRTLQSTAVCPGCGDAIKPPQGFASARYAAVVLQVCQVCQKAIADDAQAGRLLMYPPSEERQ